MKEAFLGFCWVIFLAVAGAALVWLGKSWLNQSGETIETKIEVDPEIKPEAPGQRRWRFTNYPTKGKYTVQVRSHCQGHGVAFRVDNKVFCLTSDAISGNKRTSCVIQDAKGRQYAGEIIRSDRKEMLGLIEVKLQIGDKVEAFEPLAWSTKVLPVAFEDYPKPLGFHRKQVAFAGMTWDEYAFGVMPGDGGRGIFDGEGCAGIVVMSGSQGTLVAPAERIQKWLGAK